MNEILSLYINDKKDGDYEFPDSCIFVVEKAGKTYYFESTGNALKEVDNAEPVNRKNYKKITQKSVPNKPENITIYIPRDGK